MIRVKLKIPYNNTGLPLKGGTIFLQPEKVYYLKLYRQLVQKEMSLSSSRSIKGGYWVLKNTRQE